MVKKLSALKIGEKAIIADIDSSHIKSRLLEMGLVEGVEIKKIMTAPLGDPSAYQLNGYTLSLRKKEAELVSIQPVK